ncbi:MAG: indolepyruvate oxidoreductase subunit beta [Methanomassiliicoccales archaeon]|nr:MAG: indolepyruvate oxidoreductase subunit beta [Methanomassiliicoccales archaeon]
MSQDSKFDLVICGVGGQGIVLLSNIIGSACAKADLEAKTGELHGLSQRSGTIYIHMRIGGDNLSPLIPYAEADAIVSLEAMEALRYIEYLKDDGVIILNKRVIHPPIEVAQLSKEKRTDFITFDEIKEKLNSVTPNVAPLSGLDLAKEAGNPLTENVVFIGALSALKAFPLEVEVLKESVAESVPKKALNVNLKAFDLGYKAAYDGLCQSVECVEREIG